MSKTISKLLGSTAKLKLINSVDDFILKNVYFLYTIVLFSLGYLLLLSVKGDYLTVLVFILVGFITSFFSQNMVVILLIACIFSFILRRPIDEQFVEGATDSKCKKKRQNCKNRCKQKHHNKKSSEYTDCTNKCKDKYDSCIS
jgi:hypothetical protein